MLKTLSSLTDISQNECKHSVKFYCVVILPLMQFVFLFLWCMVVMYMKQSKMLHVNCTNR